MKNEADEYAADYPPVLSRPESYGRRHAMPEWLLEAAAKAGKQYNELTGSFEPVSVA